MRSLRATCAGYLGTVVAGAGFGAAFLGAFRSLAALAGPTRRGELAATIYIAAYLAFSLPAVLAGVLTTVVGLRTTAVGYGVVVGGVVGVLAASALLLTRAGQGSGARTTSPVGARPSSAGP